MSTSDQPDLATDVASLTAEVAGLKRRLERERASRAEAERIAELGLRDLYRQQQQLQLLEAIAVASNQTSSVSDVLQFAITQVCEFEDLPMGHVYMADVSNSGVLRSTPIWHLSNPERTEEFRQATDSTDFDPGVGMPGNVFMTGTPLSVVFSDDDPFYKQGRFKRAAVAERCGLHCGFAFPVLVGQEVTAVLEFFSDRLVKLDGALLRLMAQIGTQLGRVVERKRAEEQLIHDASHDALTGLPNRALFKARLDQVVARHTRDNTASFAVLFLDLDRFKIVNDSLGHLAGDKLLIKVARRISASLRREDVLMHDVTDNAAGLHDALARLGGDEFTILLENVQSPEGAVRVGNRIIKELKAPFIIEGQEVYVNASIGIAHSMSGYVLGEEVLRDSDLAMFRAKSLGKARCEVFDRSLHALALKRLAIETDLRHAIDKQEFILHYQPIVSLKTSEVTGFEALVRWQHGERLVNPGDFIPIAEDTGLIVPIGAWVLEQACITLKKWQDRYPRSKPLTMSVNVSAREFAQTDLVARVKEVLERTGVSPPTIRLEITESVTMGNAARAEELLSRLGALGVRLSIDDFGTGYSSLSYLHRFPFDVLKIDRSFVQKMGDDGEGAQIVRTILSMARSLNMEVVAEGAEMAVHVDMLRAMECDYVQGYFYSKPVEMESATRMLEDRVLHSAVTNPLYIAPPYSGFRQAS